ncbi:YmdB family metallophosphoesterase [Streptomyces rugosispiralis]|uniref:YmdB family metallophosphoesterase n=1 Tax=Streptomyces rugosispiralis TaxID=2967341 RepID=A0ABT1V5R6_9ACTN|nr:YmdB family metallophosphoesterase [Streptomyces rugosispiralis]MCQ8192637.1 YmdB family metallophosphoesterase [Streptomyces rugosispiralis]
MKVLFLGDVVGPEAAEYVVERMPSLRAEVSADAVVVNAENAEQSGPRIRTGFGMTRALADRLRGAGVDVITSGNHAWDGEMTTVESALAHPRVVRPANMPDGLPGRGSVTIDVHGEKLTVLNLMSRSAVVEPNPLFQRWLASPDGVQPLWPAWRAADKAGAVLVDLHGLVISEKHAFAHAVDGTAAAVLGTHTHEATYHLHRLPGGTALVTDVGMTGRLGGVTGIDPLHWVAGLQGDDPAKLPPYELATGPMTLGAVVLTIEGGRTTELERVF